MDDERAGLLGDHPAEVRWTAVDLNGKVVAEIHIDFLERRGKEYHYSARYGYHDGQDTVIKQRGIKVPSWQSLNVLGILAAAIHQLSYEDLCSDRYPHTQWGRHKGIGSAIPRGSNPQDG